VIVDSHHFHLDGLTFQVEQHVRLVILEHLCYELDVHVLHVDLLLFDQLYAQLHRLNHHCAYLKTLVQHHDSFVELLLYSCIRTYRVSISQVHKYIQHW
jgi:hypothetical protein